MMQEQHLSLPLSLLKHDNNAINQTTLVVDDISVTPSIRHAQNRAAHEYAEDVDGVDDSYKIVVGFLVPALLIVQWSVEWHDNDEPFGWWTLPAASLLSIVCFMILAPSFIQIMYHHKSMSLAPIICLCVADVCVVFRLDSVALIIMVVGNLFMGMAIACKKKVVTQHRDESLREGLLCAVDTDDRADDVPV